MLNEISYGVNDKTKETFNYILLETAIAVSQAYVIIQRVCVYNRRKNRRDVREDEVRQRQNEGYYTRY